MSEFFHHTCKQTLKNRWYSNLQSMLFPHIITERSVVFQRLYPHISTSIGKQCQHWFQHQERQNETALKSEISYSSMTNSTLIMWRFPNTLSLKQRYLLFIVLLFCVWNLPDSEAERLISGAFLHSWAVGWWDPIAKWKIFLLNGPIWTGKRPNFLCLGAYRNRITFYSFSCLLSIKFAMPGEIIALEAVPENG